MMRDKKLLYLEDYGELFTDIQMHQVFVDQKTFVDCIPKHSVTDILDKYRKYKKLPDFDLQQFVKNNFTVIDTTNTTFKRSAVDDIIQHINKLWDILTRSANEEMGTLIPLPGKYIVPGGRFLEFFYWDSYFMMLGLQASKRIDLMESTTRNFAYLIDKFGFIPNANRSYFLSRSQQPFFSLTVTLLSEELGKGVFLTYLPQLEKEYQFWMKDANKLDNETQSHEHTVLLPNGHILNRYWDKEDAPRPESYTIDLEIAKQANHQPEIYRNIRAACESGWDFSSRWFANSRTIDTVNAIAIIPIDLNCLLFHLESTLASVHEQSGNKQKALFYTQKAAQRKTAIHTWLWNDQLQTFTDYNHVEGQAINMATLAMVFPLFVGIATSEQADKIAKLLEGSFLQAGGLLTTLIDSGQQWDAPNGWAPLQWISYVGLLKYGHTNLATKIKDRWTANVEQVFERTGKITEKYNVVAIAHPAGGGEYPNQDGFGWTNGVYLKMKS